MNTRILCFVCLVISIFLFNQSCKTAGDNGNKGSDLWLTTADQIALFEEIDGRVTQAKADSELPTIEVTSNKTYQTIDGFGYSLTGGSALHISNMSASARQELLQELFGRGEGDIGVSYLRVSIGSSDLDPHTFSYNDLQAGETDEDMSEFSLDPDREHLIPVLKEILAINSELKIMGSPWSAPIWMKSNNNTVGGRLLPRYYDAYALYFVKYIQGMAEEGITIDAITVQNEPLHDGNNPSMYMSANEQADFIKEASLGKQKKDLLINQRKSLQQQQEKHKKTLKIAERQKSQAEFEQLKAQLKTKTIELATKSKENDEKNRILQKLKNKLEQIGEHPESIKVRSAEILQIIDSHIEPEDNTFEIQIDELHQEFFDTLRDEFPDLTRYDLRLCAYIKIGFNSKEISNMLNIKPSSVYISRSRLRKKLNIDTDEDLHSYLNSI
ncbi:MAG: hypothetical protein JJ953_11060 [Gracilimonas sp.]|uniref:hypothetical protein n=1 Tax=Gracilimonas TaxID=649462 RepID=UPI001B1BEB26|nr:hypothetical protein [Gracilimonas sp.]MBO6586635.1 hypothetical protein [Gracilimonas sp.]MBO6615292.1 hypothetical protein [Gracilimonas sp.]